MAAWEVDLSLVASAGLAVLWSSSPAEEDKESDKESGNYWGVALKGAVLLANYLKPVKEVLAMVLLSTAAVTWGAAVYESFGLGLGSFGAHDYSDAWLHTCPRSRCAVLIAVGVWRADKIQSLLERLQRSFGVTKEVGGSAVRMAAGDPGGWIWTPFWAIFRRVALVTVSSMGYDAFIFTAFPAVALDEFCWWVTAKAVDTWKRKICDLPLWFELVVLPVVDLVHFLPTLFRILLLAIAEYPNDAAVPHQAILVVSALAWSGHNFHKLYTTACVDLPSHIEQLSGGPAGHEW